MQVLLDYLKGRLEEYGDKYIIDKLKLKNGLYIKINKDFEIIDHIFIREKEDGEVPDLYYFFLNRYFYSKILYDSANKCIDTREKKFHSTNPLSLIFKRDNLPDKITNLGSNTVNALNKQNIEIEGLSKDEIFEISIGFHFEAMDILFKSDIDYSRYAGEFRQLSYKIVELINGMDLKPNENFQIGIFMDEDLNLYKNYSEMYLNEKLFLDNKYNKEIDGVLQGVNGYSNTLNNNKPFYKMLSTPFIIPHLVSFEDAMLYYMLSFVFSDTAKELKLSFEYDFKEKEIQNLEIIDDRIKRKDFLEIKALQVKDLNDIDLETTKKKLTRDEIKGQLNYFSNNIFYAFLTKNLKDFNDTARKIYTNDKVFIPLIENRDAIRGYLNKNYDTSIEKAIERFTMRVLEYEIEKYEPLNNKAEYFNFKKLQTKWDLRVSIMTYFSERSIYRDMQKTLKKMKEDLSGQFIAGEGLIEIKDDETYYFLAGQICQYLASQSQTAYKTGRLLSPFLKAKNNNILRKLIVETYDKYSYRIPLHSNMRINRAIQSVLVGYTPEKNLRDLDMQMFLNGGLIGPNMFYEKTKKNENDIDMEEIESE